MTILDDCLAIVEPGHHAPQAQRPIFEPRIKAALRVCKCGVDEVREGRAACEECIAKSAGGLQERNRKKRSVRAAAKAKRARDRKARHDTATKPTCSCGRPAPCGRRMCR